MKTEPFLLFDLLVLSLVSGFLLGLLRNLLLFLCRILSKLLSRSTSKKKTSYPVLQAVQDLAFCLIVFCTLTVILFYYSEGKIRIFSVLALFFGFLLYRMSVGRLFVRCSWRASERVANAISWLFARLVAPIRCVLLWSFRCLAKPIRACYRKISERRVQKYSTKQMENLRKISKKGFVNI